MILNDKQLGIKLGKNGKHKYDKYYTIDNYTNNIESIYSKLINRKDII